MPASLLGGHVEHDAAHVAQKFAVHIFEIVVRAVKIVAVGEDHPGKADGLVFEFEQFGKSAQHAVLKTCIARKDNPADRRNRSGPGGRRSSGPRLGDGPHLRIELAGSADRFLPAGCASCRKVISACSRSMARSTTWSMVVGAAAAGTEPAARACWSWAAACSAMQPG